MIPALMRHYPGVTPATVGALTLGQINLLLDHLRDVYGRESE